ncbi:MAG: right-handed parallel beta-helix repeat-containing protein [Planctomycetaceae bacterium]|nr:right-handed parallel beta-helix repeat-containing protein [Planctomycetaceae bacterium]
MKRTLLAIAIIINCWSPFSFATVRNVPSQYGTIQAAINASVNGDTVVIAPGVYIGNGNRDIDFSGKAITVRGANDNPNDCVINCTGTEDEPHNGFNFTYGEGGNSILEAITIRGGYGYGGGIFISSSNPVINNCIICDNLVPEGCGGGIYNTYGSPIINKCIIRNNSGGWGAGIFNCGGSATISNCAILNNTGTIGCGAAIYNYSYSNANIRNCTISGNIMQGESVICGAYNNGVSPTMSNCIIWGNVASALIHGPMTVTYSNMQGGYSGVGNINENPLFSAGGYHLTEFSPCVNVGNPNYQAEPGETDLDGNLRVLYGQIDMGAYEFVQITPGDIDADGDVDFVDYAVFASRWMYQDCAEPNWCSGADLNKNGSVDLYDLGKFVEYWLYGTLP